MTLKEAKKIIETKVKTRLVPERFHIPYKIGWDSSRYICGVGIVLKFINESGKTKETSISGVVAEEVDSFRKLKNDKSWLEDKQIKFITKIQKVLADGYKNDVVEENGKQVINHGKIKRIIRVI